MRRVARFRRRRPDADVVRHAIGAVERRPDADVDALVDAQKGARRVVDEDGARHARLARDGAQREQAVQLGRRVHRAVPVRKVRREARVQPARRRRKRRVERVLGRKEARHGRLELGRPETKHALLRRHLHEARGRAVPRKRRLGYR